MDLELKGLKVTVTGGARGIGRAALEIFAREGCDVAFFSRGAETVAAAVDSGKWDAVKSTAPQIYQSTLDQMVLGRFGQADDAARTLIFLASPAASHTTGTNVVVDGAYTKRVQF